MYRECRSRRSERNDWSFGVIDTDADTRIEGIKQTWKALQYACESNDIPTIVTTLKAADIKLINRTLQMSYDGQNYRYDVPIFMINDPTSFETTKVEEVVVAKELNVRSCLLR